MPKRDHATARLMKRSCNNRRRENLWFLTYVMYLYTHRNGQCQGMLDRLCDLEVGNE